MTGTNGTKRAHEESGVGDRRVKREARTDDQLGGIFGLQLYETRAEGLGFTGTLELPDFLEAGRSQAQSLSNAQNSHQNQSRNSQTQNTQNPEPHNTNGQNRDQNGLTPRGQQLTLSEHQALLNVPRTGAVGTTQGPKQAAAALYQAQPVVGSALSYRSGVNTPIHVAAAQYKAAMRFDPKRKFLPPDHAAPSPAPAAVASPVLGPAPMAPPVQPATSYGFSALNASNPAPADKDKADDPSKLNDALAAAGVDIQREEELLSSNYRIPLNSMLLYTQRQRPLYGQQTPFLQPYHLAVFMNRVGRENGMTQNFMLDTEMLEFMSSACKEWISGLVDKIVAMSRHRRRGIPALTGVSGAQGASARQKVIPPSQRSEISKDLRELAHRQKTLEERRVEKRALLGLERSGDVAPETSSKNGSDETLHRAANATAAMMTMNKKYSWMTSGAVGGGKDDVKLTVGKDSGQKQSTLILARGDNGLRFRDIRVGNMITTRDLLCVIEDERMGTAKAVVKGYARLRD